MVYELERLEADRTQGDSSHILILWEKAKKVSNREIHGNPIEG